MQHHTNTIEYDKKLVDGITRRSPVHAVCAPEALPTTRSSLKLSGFKLVSVSFLAFTLLVSLSSVGSTVSYFNDTETSTGNRLQAGVTGFSISTDTDEQGKTSETNVGTESFNVTVGQSTESLPLLYTVTASSSPSGCDVLILDAHLGDYSYHGSVMSFTSPATTTMGQWQFLLSLPTENTLGPDAVCNGDIVFNASLANVASDLTHTYTDEKRYSFSIHNWVSADPSPTLPVNPDPVVDPGATTTATSTDTSTDTSIATSTTQ